MCLAGLEDAGPDDLELPSTFATSRKHSAPLAPDEYPGRGDDFPGIRMARGDDFPGVKMAHREEASGRDEQGRTQGGRERGDPTRG